MGSIGKNGINRTEGGDIYATQENGEAPVEKKFSQGRACQRKKFEHVGSARRDPAVTFGYVRRMVHFGKGRPKGRPFLLEVL